MRDMSAQDSGTGASQENDGDRCVRTAYSLLESADYAAVVRATREALRLGTHFPAAARAYCGRAWMCLRRYRKAVREFTCAIALDPDGLQMEGPLHYRRERANSYLALFRFGAARRDYEWIMRHGVRAAEDLAGLGFLYRLSGRYADAIRVYNMALSADPESYYANHGLAYILATCPRAEFRDGPRALEIALKLSERTQHRNWVDLALVAGAYAEIGRFDEAVDYARLCAAYAPEPATRERLQRIRQYERRRPLRASALLDRWRYFRQMRWRRAAEQHSPG